MRRLAVSAVAASLLCCVARPASAAGDCPGGDWFCEPAPEPPPGPDQPPPGAPNPARSPAPPSGSPFEPPPPPPPPPGEEIRIDVPNVPPAHPRRRRGFREWGVNLHAALGLMGNDDAMASNAGMNGLGGALRFRPIPYIAIEGALELMWGNDYNGFQRFEHAELANVLFYANPRSVVQFYGLAGLGIGAAYLDSSGPDGRPILSDETYRYFGGQIGVGLEGRVTRHFALGADLIGFLRARTDRHADRNPEFVDPISGRTTNTSGGGLLRLGATFYW
ncbi:MAG TPA: hypothetical protein VEQ58_15770 [Polyangiaceae bacterium]|nr:hypothetical protein [Polyangiaceae bacterium]